MRLLLDSHVFVWSKAAPQNLCDEAHAAILDPDNEVFISYASAWELWIKHAKRPFGAFASVLDNGAKSFLEAASESGVVPLEITLDHAASAAALPAIHRDPFDRMIIAQAMAERLTVVTSDATFARYAGVLLLKA